MKTNFFATTGLLFLLIISSLSCEKDNSDSELQGEVQVEITDAPVDDAQLEAVFVTIAEVQIDGQKLEGFSKTTLDIMAYQNGRTALLGEMGIDARSYNQVSLVLDYDTDASGNSPGCYALDVDGIKHRLESDDNVVRINKAFSVAAEQTTKLVIDFDLRKCMARESNPQPEDEYEFTGSGEFNSSLRVVNRDESGVIAGNCNDLVTDSETLVVFAYRKGTYDRNAEVENEADAKFRGAVSSAIVASNGDYQLHFLEEGEYEIHFASFKDEDNDGKAELQGTLLLDAITAIDLGAIRVDAMATINVNVLVTGIIPL